MNLFVRIWKDSVFSKIIATGIIALIGIIFGKMNWDKIKLFFTDSVTVFFKEYYKECFIVILLITVLFLLNKVRRNNKEETTSYIDTDINLDMEWFETLTEGEVSHYVFLFWFPLNGTLVSPSLNIGFNKVNSIRNSVLMLDLIDHGIITFTTFSRFKLNRKAYEFLQSHIEGLDISEDSEHNIKEFLQFIKSGDFSRLVENAVLKNSLGI